MNNILSKFRKRNIQANIYNFMLVIFAIAVSVCLIFGLIINYVTLKNSVNNFYSKSNLPNYWIETNTISAADKTFFDENFSYEKRFCFKQTLTVNEKTYDSVFYVSNGKASTPYIVDGNKSEGCYVNSKFVEKYNLGVNYSKIYFDYKIGDVTKTLEFKIVGSIAMAENLISDENCYVFIDENVFLKTLKAYFSGIAENDFSCINYNQILIKDEINDSDIEKINNYYASSSSTLNKAYYTSDLEDFKSIESEINKAKQMTFMFPVLFAIISILVIVSTISQLALKERYNIGLLRSFGIRGKDIVSNYCGYGLFFGFIGSLVGLVASPLIIPNITFETYDKMFSLPKDVVSLNFPVLIALIVIAISMLIGYFSTYFVVARLVKKYPKECMNKAIKININSKNKKSKMPKLFNISARNMQINLSRTIMSGFGIFGCSLLCLIGFGVEQIYVDGDFNLKTFETFAGIFKGFSIMFIVLVAVIFLVQIFNERTTEMAILRLHGVPYFKIWLSILFEMLFVGASGVAFSILLGQPVLLLVQKIFGLNNIIINFFSYLKTILIVIFVIVLTACCGIFKVYKLNISDALKNKD